MYEILLFTLTAVIIVSFSFLFLVSFLKFFKTTITINRLLLFAIFGISLGVIIDSLRFIIFIILGYLDITSDRLLFIVKFFFLFLGIAAMIRVVLILNRQSGYRVKYQSFLRYAIITTIGILNVGNLILNFQSTLVPGITGFYVFNINNILFAIILTVSLFLIFYIAFKLNQVLKEIRDKTIIKQMSILGFLFIALILERYYSIGHFFIGLSANKFLVEQLLLSSIGITSLFVFLKNPNILDDISTYFCVKSIYIIRKMGGQLLFGYDFQKEEKKIHNPENLLLAGFIFAISRGLEISLRLSGDLELIQVEDNNLVFGSGKFVAGLVFATENLPTTKLKLLLTLQKFEKYFEPILQKWTGDLSHFETDTIQEWVYEIFRPGRKKEETNLQGDK